MSGELILSADPDEVERFRVMIDARTRHADLWPLVVQYGSVKALAGLVGLSQGTLGGWVNLRSYPNPRVEQTWAKVSRLQELTGRSYEEMWPDALRVAIDSGAAGLRRSVLIETYQRALVERQIERLSLPGPPDAAAAEEEAELVRKALLFLTARERQVVEMRFFDGLTLDKTARELGVTKERVRQIEARAVFKLRDKAHMIPGLRERAAARGETRGGCS